jgi:hypothetical protein
MGLVSRRNSKEVGVVGGKERKRELKLKSEGWREEEGCREH